MNQIPGLSNYYQLTSSSRPYVVFATGQGDVAYHGPNRDVSTRTLNFQMPTMVSTLSPIQSNNMTNTTTSNATSTTNQPDSNDQMSLISFIQQILRLILSFLDSL